MNEDDARDTVRRLVGGTAYARLEQLATLVIAENDRQNLIAKSTVDTIWNRHILDSIQLLRWDGGSGEAWIDIGTGGGFPGLAIAAIADREMILVEPRRLRAAFLGQAVQHLGLTGTTVMQAKIEGVHVPADIISARAVAPISTLLQAAARSSTSATRWMFLRGQVTAEEVASLRAKFGMVFHVEQSLSDAKSAVVIGECG